MKDIEGFEGVYSITSCGRVWSHRSNGFLTPYSVGAGYLQVELFLNGKRWLKYVHRLVADAYIPNSDNLPQVNHIDGNKHNNCINNLEWTTAKKNTEHAWNSGLCGQRCKCVKDVTTGIIYSSCSEAARAVNGTRQGVSGVCRGRLKSYKNHVFKYYFKEG